MEVQLEVFAASLVPTQSLLLYIVTNNTVSFILMCGIQQDPGTILAVLSCQSLSVFKLIFT